MRLFRSLCLAGILGVVLSLGCSDKSNKAKEGAADKVGKDKETVKGNAAKDHKKPIPEIEGKP
jgi:hypothetical protein